MSSFLIDLATLQPGLTQVVVETGAADLGLDPERWTGPVRGTFDVGKLNERVSVRGWLDATARLECVRCLAAFESPLAVLFEVYAERAGTGASRSEEQELERDHYMKFHDGRRLDLAEEAREALLLEVPMTPRCREDCRGLCPRCGADLNGGPCGCGVSA
jgi:uncharacterized protein